MCKFEYCMICNKIKYNNQRLMKMTSCCNKEVHLKCYNKWIKDNYLCPCCNYTTVRAIKTTKHEFL